MGSAEGFESIMLTSADGTTNAEFGLTVVEPGGSYRAAFGIALSRGA